MARMMFDCAKVLSESMCTLRIVGDGADDLLDTAVLHAIKGHGCQDVSELREMIRGGLRRIELATAEERLRKMMEEGGGRGELEVCQAPDGSRVVAVSNAIFGASLDLTSMPLPNLILRNCIFGTLVLDDSHVQRVELQDCTGWEVSAERLVIDADLILVGVTVVSAVDFSRARVGGRLICRDMTIMGLRDLTDEDRAGLKCRRVEIEGDVDLDQCHVNGEVDLTSAGIGGTFTCTGSLGSLARRPSRDANRVALRCNGIHVKRSLRIGNPDDEFATTSTEIHGEVRLVEANVEGDVNLTKARIDNADGTALDAKHMIVGEDLYLDRGFAADGFVQLLGARVTHLINCTGGRFHNEHGLAIDASSLIAEGVYFNSDPGESRFIAEGGIRLVGARIQRHVRCSGARITAGSMAPANVPWHVDGPIALWADNMVAENVFLDEGCEFIGEVSLRGAAARRELRCTNGAFHNPQGRALTADRLTCDQVYLNGTFNQSFVAEGRVSLWAATVGFIDCRRGVVDARRSVRRKPTAEEGYKAYALDLSEIQVEQYILAQGIVVDGGVTVANAHISGDLDFTEASITPTDNLPEGVVLDGQALTVDGALRWRRLATPPLGKVDLSDGQVGGQLDDRPMSWPTAPGLLKLTGFRYGGLEEEVMDVQGRLDWLRSVGPFSQQPYEALARVYRDCGRHADAQKVRLAQQRDRTRRGKLPLLPKVWNYFLEITVGYGYQPQRILAALAIFAIFGAWMFHVAQHNGIMVAVGSKPAGVEIQADNCTANYPCFQPTVYAVELQIPVVNLRQLAYWLPDMHANPQGPWYLRGFFYLLYTWIAIVLGWTAVTALAAGISRIWHID